MIPCLMIALALALNSIGYMLLVRPAKKRARAAAEAAAIPASEPEPEPRVPADTSRPYPRPKGHSSKLNRVCPVCGTGSETTGLDGRVLGWPAHASCAEWLGDWKPGPPPFNPDRHLIGYIEQGQKPAAIPAGHVKKVAPDAATLPPEAASAMIQVGLISVDEARERLARHIASTFGVPGPDLGEPFTRGACPDCGMEFGGTPSAISVSLQVHRESGQCEQRRRKQKPRAPVFPEYCTCGKGFTGTAEENARALEAHHASGECPHSAKGRAADLRDLDGR